MAEILDLHGCPQLPLKAALRSATPARAQLFAAAPTPAPVPLLWPAQDPEVAGHHPAGGLAGEVDLYVVRDALVGGAGGHRRKDGRYLTGAAIDPGYVRDAMEKEQAAPHWAFEPGEAIRVPRAFAVTHYNHVYGHILTEVLPKLFLIRRLAAQGVRAPIALPWTAQPILREVIATVLPKAPLALYAPGDQHVAADLLLLPGMMSEEHLFHPRLSREIDDFITRLRRWRFPASRPRAVFVSRGKLPAVGFPRTLVNADELEAIAVELGLSVIHPETLSWREQVLTFADARLIVGEFGSAMHNALFAPAGTHVLCLNWVVWVQSRIANLRGHHIGYLLDPDGEPRRFPAVGGEPLTYRIDSDEFRLRVSRSLAALRL